MAADWDLRDLRNEIKDLKEKILRIEKENQRCLKIIAEETHNISKNIDKIVEKAPYVIAALGAIEISKSR